MRVRVWAWLGVWLALVSVVHAGRAYVASRVLEYGFGACSGNTAYDALDTNMTFGPITLNPNRATFISGMNGIRLTATQGSETEDAGFGVLNSSAFSAYVDNNGTSMGSFTVELWYKSDLAVGPPDYNGASIFGLLNATGLPFTDEGLAEGDPILNVFENDLPDDFGFWGMRFNDYRYPVRTSRFSSVGTNVVHLVMYVDALDDDDARYWMYENASNLMGIERATIPGDGLIPRRLFGVFLAQPLEVRSDKQVTQTILADALDQMDDANNTQGASR